MVTDALQLTEKTTVEQVGGIVLVGEKHDSLSSERLMDRVLDSYDPAAIGYELPPGHAGRSGSGIRIAWEYAVDNGVPAVSIDADNRNRRFAEAMSADGSYGRLISDANYFKHPIQDDGDLHPETPHITRQNIRDDYGPETWKMMYPRREAVMARVLDATQHHYGTPVVAAVGAFHVQPLAQILNNVTYDTSPPAERRRVHTPTN